MNWNKRLKKQFQIKRKKLLKRIESIRRVRDSAPSAMESASDTSRSESEKLVYVLEAELKNMDNVISKIPQNLSERDRELRVKDWQYVEISLGGS